MLEICVQKQLHGANGAIELDVRCSIKQGEFVALSGASGSGKTTLLRIIAGVEESNGSIAMDGDVWLDDRHALAPQKRDIGFVTQDYALFSNMTVEKNLLFVANDTVLAQRFLQLMELENLAHKYPHQLSGGQQQRVALARALMRQPKLLLLDEPLSALDNVMRIKLQEVLRTLHKEFHLTIIMVSHNANEIQNLASRVLVLEDGTIVQEKSAQEFSAPKQAKLLSQNGSEYIVQIGEETLSFTLDT